MCKRDGKNENEVWKYNFGSLSEKKSSREKILKYTVLKRRNEVAAIISSTSICQRVIN